MINKIKPNKNKIEPNVVVYEHTFDLSPMNNGGEAVILTTKFISNGDPISNNSGGYFNQELTLNSYGNSASISLYSGYFIPSTLRKIAKELEILHKKAIKQKHI